MTDLPSVWAEAGGFLVLIVAPTLALLALQAALRPRFRRWRDSLSEAERDAARQVRGGWWL